MDDALIREIRDAERNAAAIILEARDLVEKSLVGIDREFARRGEEWKAGYRDLLNAALHEAEVKAAGASENRMRDLRGHVDSIREHAAGAAPSARARLLARILEEGDGHR